MNVTGMATPQAPPYQLLGSKFGGLASRISGRGSLVETALLTVAGSMNPARCSARWEKPEAKVLAAAR